MFWDISITILSLLLLMACITDLYTSRIPNTISALLLISGLSLHSIYFGLSGTASSLAGAVVGLVAFLPMYVMGGMGAGDVKLMAAIGSHLGPAAELKAILATLIIGGVLALFVLMLRGQLNNIISRYWLMAKTLVTCRQLLYEAPSPADAANQRFPYALAITLGSGWVMYQQALIHLDRLSPLHSLLAWFQ